MVKGFFTPANSAFTPTKNSIILLATCLLLGVGSASGTTRTWTGGNSNWSYWWNWSSNTVPVAGDDVVISGNSVTVILDVSTPTLNSVTINASGNNGTNNLSISGYTLKTNLLTIAGGNNTSRFAQLSLGSGTLNCYGNIAFSGTASQAIITASGTNLGGGLNLTGNIGSGGTFNSKVGTSYISIICNGTVNQIIAGYTYYNLTVNNAVGVTLTDNVTISNNLSISSGTLACAQYQITGNATGTMTMAAGTGLTIGRNGQYDTNNFPTLFTTAKIALNNTSTVTYYGGGRSNPNCFSNIPNYGNLTASLTSGQYLDAAGNMTINGNLTINSGTTLRLAWSGLNTMNIGGQLIDNGTLEFGNNSGSGQIVTVAGNLSGAGNISMTGANLSAHTLNLNGQNNSIGTLTTDWNNSVVNYGYAGAGTQQVFASPNYQSMTISGGSAKALQGAATVNNVLTLTSGILTTTSINLLSIANTATTAIVGGSTTSYINGPVKWSLPSGLGSGSTYNFPVGNTSYLPFSLVNPTTSANTAVTVQAFSSGSGGSADGITLANPISSTEYWSLSSLAGFTNSSVSLNKPSGIGASNAIGGSSAVAGVYTSLNGTVASTTSITNSDLIGTNRFFALGQTICGYGSNILNGITFTPVIDMTSHIQQMLGFTTGQYFVMNVIKGLTYQVYTTSSPSSALKMAAYEEGKPAGPVLASSIVNTGNPGASNSNDVYLSFTSPLSGQVRVLINSQSSCASTAIKNLTVNTNVSGGSNTQDDPTAAGTDSWIGHLYDSQNTTTRLDNYLGYYAVPGLSGDPSSFQEMFGTSGTFPNGANDDAIAFDIYSNGNVRAHMLDYTFGVRYRMNSTKRGFYTVTIASDDGARLSIDGNSVYNHWDDHSPVTNANMLLSLTGSSSLVLDYYEQGGQNIIGFYNLVQLFSNTLSTNTSQALCKGTSGAAITGDDFPTTLPGNITKGGYQWTYSTSPTGPRLPIAGATSATYIPVASAAPFNNTVGVYYLYRNATLNSTYNSTTVPTSPNGNPYNANATNESNAVTVRIKGCPNYWIGGSAPVSTTWNSSTDWNTASNWSDGVPYPGDDVEFAATVNSGNAGSDAKNNMVLDNSYVAGNFKNQSGKQLIIAPATSLTVNGTITTTAGNNNQIYIKSSQSAPTLPSGSLIFHNASTDPVVRATVEMYTQAQHYNTPFVDNITLIKYYYTWQYFGIPLTSVTASPTFDGSFVRKNDETSSNTLGKWTSLVNADVLTPFKGYEITQDAPTTIVFQGTLVNSDKPIDLGYTSSAYDPGQNMLANPYTAAIDINKLTFAPSSAVENTVYLYNTGSYAQWANNNGEGLNNSNSTLALAGQYIAIPKGQAGTGSIPPDIPSMSAFMVKAISGPVSAGITIKYNDVIIPNISAQRAPQSKTTTTDKPYMEITLNGAHLGDRMWLINEPGTSHGFDNGWDGTKVAGSVGTPQLFAMEKSGNYQVSTSDDMNNTYLGFQAGIDLEDTLTFKSENLGLKYDGVYLVDLVENKVIDITKSGTQYAFKAESTAAPIKRFKITTEAYVKNAQDLTTQIKVFNDNDAVFVDNSSNQKGELYFYDLMGRYLKKEIFGPTSISSFPLSSVSGVYVVKAVTSTEKVSKKIIVNKQSE